MRRSLILGLLVTVTFAGCVDEAGDEPLVPDASGVDRSRDGETLAFARPLTLGTMTLGAEPSIAAAPDGTLYVTTPKAVWRSDDDGATWTNLGEMGCILGVPACPLLEQPDEPQVEGGGDADLWVTPDGRVHWLGLSGAAGAIPYQYSDDRGETWSAAVDLSDGASGDREWITSRPDGTLFASWRHFPQGDSMIASRASYDGGATWTEISRVADDTRMGGVCTDPTSPALALPYDPNGDVYVARSFDDGATWESVQAVDDARQGQVFPVCAFDGAGNLYLVYAHDPDGPDVPVPVVGDRPMEDVRVFLQVSTDKGATWSEPRQVNSAGTTAWFPWIAAGADGRIVVTWYQSDEGLPRWLTQDVWVMAGVSIDATANPPSFAKVRVDPDPIHFGPECRENPGCTRSTLDFFEVAIHPDGFAAVTYAHDRMWPVPRVSVAVGVMDSGPRLV